jgi:hypothetical protein
MLGGDQDLVFTFSNPALKSAVDIFGIHFGDVSQSEKLSEIKPPLQSQIVRHCILYVM